MTSGPWSFGPGDQWTAVAGAPRLIAFSEEDVQLIDRALQLAMVTANDRIVAENWRELRHRLARSRMRPSDG